MNQDSAHDQDNHMKKCRYSLRLFSFSLQLPVHLFELARISFAAVNTSASMEMAFWGQNRKNAAEYEPLPSSDPAESGEAEILLPQHKPRALGVRKVLTNLGWIAVFGTALMV